MKSVTTILLVLISSLAYSQVILNEVQSSNSSTIADESGEYEDWIELYNPTDSDIEIGGLVFKDNVDVWRIPSGDESTLLPPGGYFILWADDEEPEGIFHTNFKLSASNGEFLGLYESDSITLIESVELPPMSGDQSYVKCMGEWEISNSPTPLASNGCKVSGIRTTESIDLIVFPTISKGELNIQLSDLTESINNIYLYSLDGKLVLKKQFYNKEITIDLSTLNNAVYSLVLITESQSFNQKVVLVK